MYQCRVTNVKVIAESAEEISTTNKAPDFLSLHHHETHTTNRYQESSLQNKRPETSRIRVCECVKLRERGSLLDLSTDELLNVHVQTSVPHN